MMKVTLQNIILPRLYTITWYIYIHTPRHRARVSITLSSTIGHPSHLTSFFLLSFILSAQISPQLAELKVYPRMSPKKPIPINNPTANILWKLYPLFLLLHKHTRVYIPPLVITCSPIPRTFAMEKSSSSSGGGSACGKRPARVHKPRDDYTAYTTTATAVSYITTRAT